MRLYKCPNCNKEFNSYDLLQFSNEDEKDDEKKELNCPACGAELDEVITL